MPPWPSGNGASLTWSGSQVRVLPGVLRLARLARLAASASLKEALAAKRLAIDRRLGVQSSLSAAPSHPAAAPQDRGMTYPARPWLFRLAAAALLFCPRPAAAV